MDDAAAFIAAIRAEPLDDAPRLIYADWLDETGLPERGEFIRLQCAAARLPGDDPEAIELTCRAADLASVHEIRWLGEWMRARLIDWTWERGCITGIEIGSRQFIHHGEELFLREPIVKVRFTGAHGEGISAEQIRAVTRTPHMAQVRALDLSNSHILGEWLTALGDCGLVEELDEIELPNLIRQGVGVIEPLLDLFRRIRVGNIRIPEASSWAGSLFLAVTLNRIGSAAAPFVRYLASRSFGPFAEWGRVKFANATELLRALEFDRPPDASGRLVLRVEPGGLACLREPALIRHLEHLRHLEIRCSRPLQSVSVFDLFQGPNLRRLTHLTLHGLAADELQELLTITRALPCLRKLHLGLFAPAALDERIAFCLESLRSRFHGGLTYERLTDG